jgi:alkylation response protein AidB-like acyl-CoA dehydrogenase
VATDNNDADAAIRVPHAKKFAVRAATRGVERCMQALGAKDYCSPRPGPPPGSGEGAHYLDGTTEVQNLVIEKDLFDYVPPGWFGWGPSYLLSIRGVTRNNIIHHATH